MTQDGIKSLEHHFPALLCKGNQGWEPLPGWTNFYMSVGASVAGLPVSDKRLIVAIANPTRSFAAAFSSLGVIKCRLGAQTEYSDNHFEKLCALPKNTPLMFKDGTVVVRVFVDGVVEAMGHKFLRVLRKPKRKSQEPVFTLLPVGESRRLTRLADESKPTKLSVGREISSKFGFISGFAGSEAASAFLMSPQLDCAVVGVQSMFRREVCEFAVAWVDGDDTVTGSLNELILVRKFTGTTGIYHSDIYKPAPVSKLPEANSDTVVIFDGANGFLNCRHNFPTQKWIVLLDRTEPQFGSAVQAINQESARGQSRLCPDEIGKLIPGGVELSSFEVQL